MYFKNLLQKLEQFSFFDTFKHASTYFSGTALVHALGLLTMPIFVEYLSTEEYGIINVFTSYVTVATVLMSLNLHWAITRYYFEKEKDDFNVFLANIFIAVTVVFWGISSLILFNQKSIAYWTNMPENTIIWMVLTSYLMVLYSFFEQVTIANKKSKQYSFVQVTWQYTKFACTVIGLVYLSDVVYFQNNIATSYTYMGKIIGEWIATTLIILYTSKEVFKLMSFKSFSLEHLKYAIIYSIPLIPFALSNHILNSFDQVYIHAKVGQAEAGQYAFAYKIGMLYLGLGVALLNGSQPAYYKFMNEGKHREVWQQVDSMSKLLVLGAGFLILFAVDVGTLLSSKDTFLKALPIAPVIVGGYVFHGISSFYNRGIYYSKKNIYLSFIILTSGIINIVLNVLLITKENYQIAAYITLFSYIIMMCLSIIITKYVLKLPSLPLGRILKYIVLLGAIVSLNYILGKPDLGLDIKYIIFKIILFGALALSFFYNKIGLFLKKSG